MPSLSPSKSPSGSVTSLTNFVKNAFVASAAARRKVLSRSWDAFEIPLPFSAVAVVVGAPIEPSGAVDVDRERLQRALSGARAVALSLCGQMHG